MTIKKRLLELKQNIHESRKQQNENQLSGKIYSDIESYIKSILSQPQKSFTALFKFAMDHDCFNEISTKSESAQQTNAPSALVKKL